MSENPPMADPPSRYPTKAEDWLCRVENRLWGEIEKLEPKPHDHGTNSALVGVGFALLEIRDELRRSNDSRDQFYTEVLGLLVRITEDPQPGPEGDGSLRSGQPAAAPDGQEGREGE